MIEMLIVMATLACKPRTAVSNAESTKVDGAHTYTPLDRFSITPSSADSSELIHRRSCCLRCNQLTITSHLTASRSSLLVNAPVRWLSKLDIDENEGEDKDASALRRASGGIVILNLVFSLNWGSCEDCMTNEVLELRKLICLFGSRCKGWRDGIYTLTPSLSLLMIHLIQIVEKQKMPGIA